MTTELKDLLSLYIVLVVFLSPFALALYFIIYTRIKIYLSKGELIGYREAVKQLKE